MSGSPERRAELRAKMTQLLYDLPSNSSMQTLKANAAADIRAFAILTLTLSAAILLYGMGRPLVVAPAIVGLGLGALLLCLEKLSLSAKIERVEYALDKLLSPKSN